MRTTDASFRLLADRHGNYMQVGDWFKPPEGEGTRRSKILWIDMNNYRCGIYNAETGLNEIHRNPQIEVKITDPEELMLLALEN